MEGKENRLQAPGFDIEPIYVELAGRIVDADKVRAPQILKRMFSVEQAEIIRLMPATAEQVAETLRRDREEVERSIRELVRRGALLVSGKGEWKLPSSMVHIQDYGCANPEFDGERGEEFFELFKALRTEKSYLEMIALYLAEEGKESRRVRVLPRWKAVKNIPGAMPCEDLREILKAYDGRLSTSRCGCRLMVNDRHCAVHEGTRPEEGHCIHFDKAADYYVQVLGVGRYQGWQEVFENMEILEKSPIYHTVDNNRDVKFICNCCSCCCDINWPATRTGSFAVKDIISPSRFLCVVSREKCSGCGICVTKCPFFAMEMNGHEKRVAVDAEKCMGCGACVVNCPDQALKLKLVRPPEHIPEMGRPFVDVSFEPGG
jgi:ferredoxin